MKGGTLFVQYSIKVSKSQPLCGRISTTVHVNPQQMYQGSVSKAEKVEGRKKKKREGEYLGFYKTMESFVAPDKTTGKWMKTGSIQDRCRYESWLDIIRLVIYGRRQMHALCRYGVVNIVNVTRETRLKGNKGDDTPFHACGYDTWKAQGDGLISTCKKRCTEIGINIAL